MPDGCIRQAREEICVFGFHDLQVSGAEFRCVHRMSAQMPEAEYGPYIRFRESSFMDSPQLPAALKDNVLTVTACAPEVGCKGMYSPARLFRTEEVMERLSTSSDT